MPKAGGGRLHARSHPPPLPYCAQGGHRAVRPRLCNFLQPSIAISYASGEPAIWSVEPINKLYCQGSQFDTFANNIDEGWACIAVGTVDKVGNFSVSAPLRVYIKYDYDAGARRRSSRPSARTRLPAPVRPRAARAATTRRLNTVTPGPCTTRKFRSNIPTGADYICYLGDCQGPLH